MKTKTYKMWASDAELKKMRHPNDIELVPFKTGIFQTPVTITIEVPEPKIEITPSELKSILISGDSISDIVANKFGEGWDE